VREVIPVAEPDEMCRGRFAAIVPVGPEPIDVERALGMQDRRIGAQAHVPSTCRTITIVNARQSEPHHWKGVVCASVLAALRAIHAQADPCFAIKIDTDALVIGPFADRVHRFLAGRPDAGLVGVIGISCNPAVRVRENLERDARLLRASRAWPVSSSLVEPRQRAMAIIHSHIDAAVAHGYGSGEYCQGGAFVITRPMLDRMAAAGYLAEPEIWLGLDIPDDQALPMYSRAVGLRLHDCSQAGLPFGIQYRGLAYAPAELLERQHALIHSLKNDRHSSEDAIREFFRQHRIERAAAHSGLSR
jgi:hypothetical protein